MARYKIDRSSGKTLIYNDSKGKWEPERKKSASKWDFSRSFQVIPDIQEFVSPIDGSLISSRSQLRAHERQHKVRQVGTDFKPGEIIADTRKKQRAGEPLPKGVELKWI